MIPRRAIPARDRAARVCLIAAAVAAAGCNNSDLLRIRYRAEQRYWSASRAEAAARSANEPPDSLGFLSLCRIYRSVGSGIDLSEVPTRGAYGRAVRRGIKHVLGGAELDGGRMGLEANRLDLALEACQRVTLLANEDTLLRKEADFFRIQALRAFQRDAEAVAEMERILRVYEPALPRGGAAEDPVLSLPEGIVVLRQRMGDAAGAAKAIQSAEQYYRDQLNRGWPPEAEAGIRARLVRLELEARDWDSALGDLRRLQGLAQVTPSLGQLAPEIQYFEASIKGKRDPDPTGAVYLFDTVVAQYPRSPFAARAAFDAAMLLESHGSRKDALERYRAIGEGFADNADVAPDAAYHRALLEDAQGDWDRAKVQLEAIPYRYPESQAALDAPLAIARHYQAAGAPDAAQAYLRKAISTYQELIVGHARSPYRAGYRWSIAQAQFQLGQWNAALATIDEMVINDPGHPLTAQGVLQAGKAAEAHNQRDRAIGYFKRYLDLNPDPARVSEVQRELSRLQ